LVSKKQKTLYPPPPTTSFRMGAASSISSEVDVWAFKVCEKDYDRYKLFRKECIENDEEAYCEDENVFLMGLSQTFNTARVEKSLFIGLCKSPAVILYKWEEAMNAEERKEYTQTFDETVEAQEKLLRKQKAANTTNNDYSQSFSGSAADTKAEKDAAKLMRGDEAEKEDEENPLLAKPSILTPREGKLLRSAGTWHKYLASSDCYMYIHRLSREILSMKPSEYEEEPDSDDSGDSGSGGRTKEEETKDPANGLLSCTADELLQTVESVQKEGMTALILDTSEEQVAKTFYEYKARLEDMSVLTIPYAKGGIKRNEAIERIRVTLVGAMKAGATFALYLGMTTWENADFKKKLCKKDVFPIESFQDSGAKLLNPKSNPKYKLIFREEDLENGEAVLRDGFKTVFISSLGPYEFESALETTLPLGSMTAIYLRR